MHPRLCHIKSVRRGYGGVGNVLRTDSSDDPKGQEPHKCGRQRRGYSAWPRFIRAAFGGSCEGGEGEKRNLPNELRQRQVISVAFLPRLSAAHPPNPPPRSMPANMELVSSSGEGVGTFGASC
jgi:hypothetical protein